MSTVPTKPNRKTSRGSPAGGTKKTNKSAEHPSGDKRFK